jgi:glycosyltransferase involved in cell wall biosynthesis
MRISVVVPAYRRPRQLSDCLQGLQAQSRPADELIVGRRRDDEASAAVVADHVNEAREVIVDEPGVVSAIAAGFQASTGDVIALTDDDAVPRPDWVDRIVRHFADPTVGVLGGRDVLGGAAAGYAADDLDVRLVTSWGKLVSNHHTGGGESRDVDVLKGMNLAVRRAAAAIPARMRGRGAQPHWEVPVCLWARARGWRVVYDPQLLVDHYPGERPAGDRRGDASPDDVAAEAYNLVVGILSHRPELTWRRAAYGLLIGDHAVPGAARAAWALVRRDWKDVRRLSPSLAGQFAALRDVRTGEAPPTLPLEPSEDPVRVTLVAHDIHNNGGMELAMAELIRRAGHRVAFTVVSSHIAPSLRRRIVRWKRVPVPRRPFPLRFALFYALGGLRVRRLDGELVHTCGAIVPNRVDLATVHLCHAGVVAATGRLAPSEGSMARRLNTALTRYIGVVTERWTYGRARARTLAVVSPELGREVLASYAAARVVVTPNGVDLARFGPDPAVRAAVRCRHAVPDDELLALFVGGDWSRKGIRASIEAVAIADLNGVALRLWVIGAGDEPRYRALARDLGVDDRIVFFGPRADTETYYRAADVFVLPSLYETFSLAAHEAAAAGLPVISTPVSGVSGLVGSDDAGILVAPTAGSVAEALERLSRDPLLRQRLGEEGRRRVSRRTWEASVDDVVDVYRTLLGPLDPSPTAGSYALHTGGSA